MWSFVDFDSNVYILAVQDGTLWKILLVFSGKLLTLTRSQKESTSGRFAKLFYLRQQYQARTMFWLGSRSPLVKNVGWTRFCEDVQWPTNTTKKHENYSLFDNMPKPLYAVEPIIITQRLWAAQHYEKSRPLRSEESSPHAEGVVCGTDLQRLARRLANTMPGIWSTSSYYSH